MYGEFLDNLNKPTRTGRAIWFVSAWFRLGGQTKLSELNIKSMKKMNVPIICEEESSDTLTSPDIPEDTPIDSHL